MSCHSMNVMSHKVEKFVSYIVCHVHFLSPARITNEEFSNCRSFYVSLTSGYIDSIIMPRNNLQRFAFGRQQGTYDLDMDSSDCSSLTDEYDSDDSDSLDFGSVGYGDRTGEAVVEEATAEDEAVWDDDEYPPLPINKEALKHIASQLLSGNHGKCIDITVLPRGSSHEILLLHFEDGWSCICSFARDNHEPLAVLESEVATAEYVRKHSTILVRETYFVNPDPNHAVGAAFTLREKIEGEPLCKLIIQAVGRFEIGAQSM